MDLRVNKKFFEDLFDYTTKYNIFYGGSGSGKSVYITQKLIVKCLKKRRKMLVLRKTQVTLRDSVISCFISQLERMGVPYSYLSTYRELRIGDSIILFKGIDDPERVKSIEGITDIWLEEASEFSPDDFTQLVLRLRTDCPDLQYYLSFNPISQNNWCYRYFFNKEGSEYFLHGRSYKICHSTWMDNVDNLPKSYISDLLSLQRSNPNYYNIYALGQWGVLGKLIFPYGSYTIKKLDIPVGAKYIDGLDLGWNDPNALACSAVWKEVHPGGETRHILYTYKEWSASEQTADQIAAKLKEMCGNRIIYGDNAAAAQIAEIQKKGVYNLKANKKPSGSVLATINSIKCYDWYIDPSCTELIRELGIYQWKKDKDTGLYLEEPERGSGETHVNLLDGVRYSLEGLGSNVRTLNVKLGIGI